MRQRGHHQLIRTSVMFLSWMIFNWVAQQLTTSDRQLLCISIDGILESLGNGDVVLGQGAVVFQRAMASALGHPIGGTKGGNLVGNLTDWTIHARGGNGKGKVEEQGKKCGQKAEHLEANHHRLKGRARFEKDGGQG